MLAFHRLYEVSATDGYDDSNDAAEINRHLLPMALLLNRITAVGGGGKDSPLNFCIVILAG
jgi:hypothetical protein